MTKRNRQKYK